MKRQTTTTEMFDCSATKAFQVNDLRKKMESLFRRTFTKRWPVPQLQSWGQFFSYLMTKASTRSDFKNANAKSGNSSASGLYQFVSNTWLDMVDKYGSKYGLGQYADAITRNADGTPGELG